MPSGVRYKPAGREERWTALFVRNRSNHREGDLGRHEPYLRVAPFPWQPIGAVTGAVVLKKNRKKKRNKHLSEHNPTFLAPYRIRKATIKERIFKTCHDHFRPEESTRERSLLAVYTTKGQH